jgi:hypothetical protein
VPTAKQKTKDLEENQKLEKRRKGGGTGAFCIDEKAKQLREKGLVSG